MKHKKSEFTFIDLFAGIGGFHQAMHELGGECVFASEIDEHARKTYEHNFKDLSPKLFEKNLFNKDIKTIMPEEIPDFDVLCAGFPCQPFSHAGKGQGFDDSLSSERGNLFFDIAHIIEAKKPKAFFLENVRGLINHDNGNTFKEIQSILLGLGYSFYHQIIKASDYGLPQLRPRAFMIGFRNETLIQDFKFPEKVPLKFTMSDVWDGSCSRDIGFTLRIGGRGSSIDDRRNWDSYLVDGVVKRLTYIEAQKMQGFPSTFEFPVSPTQAIKQLGNSVAIDAVKMVGNNLIKYMHKLEKSEYKMKPKEQTKMNNKGELTEFFAFLKILMEQKLPLSDELLNPKNDFFKINKVTTKNLDLEFSPLSQFIIESFNKVTNDRKIINIENLLNNNILNNLRDQIIEGKGTFKIDDFEVIQNNLGFNVIKGGKSTQKADIVLGIEHPELLSENEGFGIKSYLGSKPTLLNASANTNFLFEIENLDKFAVKKINEIDTTSYIKDRLQKIKECGGKLKYLKAEKDTMNYNLKMVDTLLPDIIGYMLLAYYEKRISKLTDIADYLCSSTDLLESLNIDDKSMLENKLKTFLVAILLGFFAGTKWDGSYESNGTIVVKKSGELLTFHVIDLESLKNYLYKSIKLDTASPNRHKFGTIIQSQGNKLFLKLNLQLRF